MKNEIIGLVVFGALKFLMETGSPAVPVSGLGGNEVYLVFALVFTFAAGMEVVK